MPLIAIGASVGRKGRNRPHEVAAIAAALVAVGPDRGGIYGPPLSLEGLAQAIEMFQKFQRLPAHDGRVDPGGATLRRINDILNPGASPPGPPAPAGQGELRPMTNASGLANAVNDTVWAPIETSLASEFVFRWTGTAGKGRIAYFELADKVVPRWFGTLVPEGTVGFDKAHIFFHPTPAQAGYADSQYHSRGNWTNIFHYLSDDMGVQFCAAATGRVLIMPLMTQGAAGDCGVFPQRWESIVGRILGMLKSGDMSGSAAPAPVSSVVVSSFSSGITYSYHFRRSANLGARLTGVIDFDGIISTYRALASASASPAGRVVSMQQMPSTPQNLGPLAARNIFPLSRPRWGGPYENLFPKNEAAALLKIHGTIPQTMMHFAARRLG